MFNKNTLKTMATIAGLTLLTTTAHAAKLSDVVNNVSDMGTSLVDAINTFAKVGGIGIFVWGLWDWYQTGQQGSQVKMKTVITKLLVGGSLFAAPFLLDATSTQLTGGQSGRVSEAQRAANSNVGWK